VAASTLDVLDLLDASVAAASAGAAMEMGLFWLLEDGPLTPAAVAERLDVPPGRARVWLRILEYAGLLEASAGGYGPSEVTRRVILAGWSRETWAMLAQEARERAAMSVDLPRRLREDGGTESKAGYLALMATDPERARRFTRMLCEIHAPLAARIAMALDLEGDRRLLDLGGGSGIVSMALARRWPDLACTVMDIPNVCRAGREIAQERGLQDRVTYLAGDILRDPLPTDLDVILDCDVGVFDAALFGRVRKSLRPGGRFVVVDRLPVDADAPPAHLSWALEHVLADPAHVEATFADIRTLLGAAGFSIVSERPLLTDDDAADEPFSDEVLIEARAV
jgi:SAM-dependent methyltransferase